MVKKWFLVGLILLLVPWLLVGCGVAQEQYDAVVSDLGKTQQELQSVKAELEATQAKVSELTSSQEKAKTELEATQAEHEAFKSDLNTLWTSLDKKLGLGGYLIRYWAVAAVGDEETGREMTLNMVKYVDAVRDAELSQLWQDAMSYAAEGKEAEFMASFSLLMIRTVELSGEGVEAMEAKLAK